MLVENVPSLHFAVALLGANHSATPPVAGTGAGPCGAVGGGPIAALGGRGLRYGVLRERDARGGQQERGGDKKVPGKHGEPQSTDSQPYRIFWTVNRLRANAWYAHRFPSESPFSRAGVYILKQPPPRGADVHLSDECRVSGWVALSGRVVEHEHGYRADRAVIRRLRLGVGTHLRLTHMEDVLSLAAELEQRYQAPVNLGQVERRFAARG